MPDGTRLPPLNDQSGLKTRPHNLDAEQALLGAMLYDNDVWQEVGDWLRPEHFYDPVHGRIYEAIAIRCGRGSQADAIVLKNDFERDGGIDEIGGTAYLATLLESAADSASAVEYGKLIFDLARRRELIRIGEQMIAAADEAGPDIHSGALIESAESRLAELTGTEQDETSKSGGDALRELLDDPVTSVETGLVDLDRKRLFTPGVIIVAGRSSMGKSALVCDIARRAAARGRASILFSNEMTDRQVAARWGSSSAQVPYEDILHGHLDGEQRHKVHDAALGLDELPLTVCEVPGLSIGALRARVRRWKRDQLKAGREIGVVCIDYLQNISADGNSIYEKVSNIALGLQTMALALKVPLVIACQISRAAETDKDKRPSIRHLRDSGKIEEIADSVILLYRDSYYAARETPADDPIDDMERLERAQSREIEADVAKNRLGAIGRVSLWAHLPTNRFDNWSGR